jgi:hypothetical protein
MLSTFDYYTDVDEAERTGNGTLAAELRLLADLQRHLPMPRVFVRARAAAAAAAAFCEHA